MQVGFNAIEAFSVTTEEVAEKNGVETVVFQMAGTTKLCQAFELIQLGAFANFYLSILYGQNPAPIPWVDYFKERLDQPLGNNLINSDVR